LWLFLFGDFMLSKKFLYMYLIGSFVTTVVDVPVMAMEVSADSGKVSWNDLHTDMKEKIFTYLPPRDLGRLMATNKKTNSIWEAIISNELKKLENFIEEELKGQKRVGTLSAALHLVKTCFNNNFLQNYLKNSKPIQEAKKEIAALSASNRKPTVPLADFLDSLKPIAHLLREEFSESFF
jgi:hypothetical protein